MRKIILYSAVTIDGLIARPDGRVDWLDDFSNAPGDEDYGYADFISSIDTTVMGHATYRISLKLGGMPAMAGFTNIVLTRQKNRAPEDHVTFVSDNIEDVLNDLRRSDGKNIWLLGGGQVNSFLIQKGLIDDMVLTVAPIVLGGGIPLFAQPAPSSLFTLKASRTFPNGLVQSSYTINPTQ